MTRSVYVIGGAGTGKSTFTAELLDRLGHSMGPLVDLYSKPNSRGTVITLRGHRLSGTADSDGIYLGCMRDQFPGTDGLDRVSYIPGEEWLATAPLPDFLIGEGATLAVRRFLYALDVMTDLLIVHLVTEPFVKEFRLEGRGSDQDPKFIAGTETRSRNLAEEMAKAGAWVRTFDSGVKSEWEQGLELSEKFLRETLPSGTIVR